MVLPRSHNQSRRLHAPYLHLPELVFVLVSHAILLLVFFLVLFRVQAVDSFVSGSSHFFLLRHATPPKFVARRLSPPCFFCDQWPEDLKF